MNIESVILSILNQVIDTELGLTLPQMGVIASQHLEEKQLTLTLITGFPCNFLQKHTISKLTASLNAALPEYRIQITLRQHIKAHATQLIGQSLRHIKNTIAIASGKGGVGKSTVTINLAVALMQQGARVGILDADIYGPSIPLMLGETAPVQIQDEHYLPVNAHGLQAMSIGYITQQETALIWRGPMLAKTLIQMLDLTRWEDLDYLLIDLPPGTGDIQLSLVQKIPLTAAIIVTTPQSVATLDAQKALSMFNTTQIHTLGILENMSLHICQNCGHQDPIFGQDGAEILAKSTQTNLLGKLPLDARISLDCERGTPTALFSESELAQPFMNAAFNLSVALAKRPLNYASKFPPIRVHEA